MKLEIPLVESRGTFEETSMLSSYNLTAGKRDYIILKVTMHTFILYQVVMLIATILALSQCLVLSTRNLI